MVRVAGLTRVSRWSIEVIRTVVILTIVLAVGAAYTARSDNHDTTFWACLYAGSLTQVGTTEPANCGRGEKVSWNAQGIPGEPGIPGVSGYAMNMRTTVAGGGIVGPHLAVLECFDGLVPVSGGYSITGDDAEGVVVTRSMAVASTSDNPFDFPLTDDPILLTTDFGWEFEVINTFAPTGGGYTMEFYVYCVDVELPEQD